MIKKILFNIFSGLFVFLTVFLISEFDVKAESLDMHTYLSNAGRYWSISGNESSTDLQYNNYVVKNYYTVVGALYVPPTQYDYIEYSFFNGPAINPCNGSSYTVDLGFYFSNPAVIDYITSIKWGAYDCTITSEDGNGNLYATCTVANNENNVSIKVNYDIIYDTNISSEVYIFRYNELTCSSNNSVDLGPIINQNQTIIDQNNQTNNKLNDINDSINSDNIDDFSDTINSFKGFLEENSTITKLVTLPVTLYSSILNNINSTCSPFNLGSLYGEPLILPCINIGNYLGSTLWGMIDLIISGFAIYAISKKFIKIFNNFSTLKEGDILDD